MIGLEDKIAQLNASSEAGDRAMAKLLETGICDCLTVFRTQRSKEFEVPEIIGAVISVFVAELLHVAGGLPLDQQFHYGALVRQHMTEHFDAVFVELVTAGLRK